MAKKHKKKNNPLKQKEPKFLVPNDYKERDKFFRDAANEEMRNFCDDTALDAGDVQIIIEKWFEIGRNSK